MKPRRFVRSPWRALVVVLVNAGITLALAELGARIFLDPPRYHGGRVELDGGRGFRGVPNLQLELTDLDGPYLFRLNRQGLRGREIPDPGPKAGPLRAIFVGDSFLVGEGVREDQLITSRVEAALSEGSGDAEVYNLSTLDYGTFQELLLCRRWVDRIQPAFVVLALYPANDLINNAIELAGTSGVSPGDLLRPYPADADGAVFLHPWRAVLRRGSRFVANVEQQLLARGVLRAPAGREAATPARRLVAGRAPREDLEIFRRHGAEDAWERAWQTTFSLLRAFRDECAGAERRLLFLVVPHMEQVRRGPVSLRWDIEARTFAGRPIDALLDWNLPEQRLSAFFEAVGLESVFLLPRLRGAVAAQPEAPPYLRDGHLSAEGQAIAAAAVTEWWEKGASHGAASFGGPPVRALPPVGRMDPWLDFGRDPEPRYLGDGWLSWEARRGKGESWGWSIASTALIALPGQGDLVIRGWIAPDADLPVQWSVQSVGARRSGFLTAPGAFELRVPRQRLGRFTSSEGYMVVVLGLRDVGGSAHSGARVRGIGFRP